MDRFVGACAGRCIVNAQPARSQMIGGIGISAADANAVINAIGVRGLPVILDKLP